MSLRIRTVISGVHKYLDLFDDEDILMSFSVGEIQDITSKNSSYSKSFTLPGTKNNNDIFNYFYDVNSVPLDFDPNDKFDAIISWDGYEILVGNIRLDGVTIQGEDFTYQITFYNQVGNLSANIGDKFLRQTDLSHLSHPFTEQVILQSNVDYNLFPITGATNYSYQNGKTMWGLYNIGYSYSGNSRFIQPEITPLVEFSDLSGLTYTPKFGYFDFSGTPVNDYYFKPTLQIKELYSSIVRDAGYEIQSDFFDTSYFERFYLPLKFLDETVYSRNAIIPCYTYENLGFFFSTSPQSASTNPSSGVICNTLNLSATTEFINIPPFFAGLYTFKFSYTAQRNLFSGCGFTIINTGPGNLTYQYRNSSGVVSTGFIPSIDIGLPYNVIGEFLLITGGNGTVTNETSSDVSLFYNDYTSTQVLREDGLCSNETSTTQVEFTKDFNFTGNSDIQFYFFGTNATISNFKFEIFTGPRFLVSGQTFDYALEFPDNDYKQIDFITSINRYFNLVVVPSPDKPNTLIIEPIVDYFGKGELLDWTTKVDYNQLQSLSPTTSLINGTLQFNFQLDQDYANQDFKTASNKVFGTDKINLNIPYKNSSTNFTYIFSSPIDITINSVQSNYLTLSSFSKIKNTDVTGTTLQQFQPFKILPRVVFRGLTLPSLNYGFIGTGATQLQTWYMQSFGTTYPQTRFTNINRFTTYPFNYSGFSHYINFRGEDLTTIQPREFEFLAEDLYDIYYKDYIDDLISPENKIYKLKIYLTPNEVKSLLFNETILIKNSLFRINKIDNFNLLEPSICDLELVKLTKTYDEHRKLYYDLIPCVSGATRYSNSDLNYNLYAYIGNYVTLFDDDVNALGCHQVVQGSYNENNNYQHYYISSGFTPNFVNAYSDCNCTGFTAFDVVQDGSVVPPVPSATPTPTPTSTQVPTPTPTTTQTSTPTTTQTPTVTQTPTNTQTPTTTQTPTNTQTPTITASPTVSPTNTNTPTTTTTQTPTPSNVAFDSDAAAYLGRVLLSGGTLSPTISAATNTFFTTLKSTGVYTRLKAMYPFVGGTAASHAINALTSSQYTITWFGGMSHGVSGATGNGSNAYGRTGYLNGSWSANSISHGFYQLTENTPLQSAECIMGGFQSAPFVQTHTNLNPNRWAIRNGPDLPGAITSANTGNIDGFYINNRNSSTNYGLYRCNNLVVSASSTYTPGPGTVEQFLFVLSVANAPFNTTYANQTLSFAFIADGLTTLQMTDLYNAVQTYQTSLSRSVTC
jgi:hypothetical protein